MRFKVKLTLVRVIIFVVAVAIFAEVIYSRTYSILPTSSINLINDLILPTNSDKVVIFSPHPDDETLGACGLIQKDHDADIPTWVVIVTDGNKHGKKALRYQEVTKATTDCGLNPANIIFYDYPDSQLSEHKSDLVLSLQDTFDRIRPTYIITTDPSDIHADHATLGATINEEIKSLDYKPIVYDFLIHYHRYPRPLGLNKTEPLLPPATLIDDKHSWKKLTLTSGEISTKEKAVNEYKSQLSTPTLGGLMKSFIRTNELFSVHQIN